MKKIVSIFMVAIMLICYSTTVSAATSQTNEIMPLWDNITQVTNTISFSGSNGSVHCSVLGDAGTTVTAQVKVYRQTASGAWSYVGGDSGSSSTNSLYLTVNFTAKSGAYYKSVLTTTVNKNGVEEDASKTTYKTCP